MTRMWWLAAAALAAVTLSGCGDEGVDGPASGADAPSAADGELVMLATPTCACCGEHAAYLEEHGYEVATRHVDDPNAEVGVPEMMGL